jgi:FeS assembly SUF system protein
MSATITAEQVLEKLKEVYDPEIPVNVVDLGLIYDVQVSDENEVHITMTLTAPGCGMGPYIGQQAEWAVAELEGLEDVTVEMTFDPPWSPDMLTEDGKTLLGI